MDSRRWLIATAILSVAWLSQARAVEIFDGHPRLFFRDSAWGERSITTDQLKARYYDSRYAAYRNRLTYSAANYALEACLSGDSTAAEQCIAMLQAPFDFDGTTTDGELVMWAAMAYDWLYNHPLFTDEIKAGVADRIASGGIYCQGQYVSQGTHIFHTRMPAFAVGAALAGLALYGDHPDAPGLVQWADSVFTNRLFPARQLQDGTAHNSLAYGRRYTMWHPGHFMSAWYSATGEDKWADVRAGQGDWAWREALFLIYAREPDSLFIRYGDNYRRTSERFTFRLIGERGFAYDEPVARGYLDYLFATQAVQRDNRVVEEGNAYNVFLWWDADDHGVTFKGLPHRAMFSPQGTGMVIWRTGWDEGESFIFFKCGNYFGDHGHFDQGHVEVFRHKPLLIEGGYYDSFSSNHRSEYYHTSLAHNTIRARSLSSPTFLGRQRMFSNQNEESVEGYLSHTVNETGDLIDYRDNGTWAYAAGEFSKAYDPGVFNDVVRELAWIGDRYLVVVDNIEMGGTGYVPAVLWHYTVKPQLGDGRFTVSDGGGKAVISVLAPAGAVIDTVPAYQVGTKTYPPPNPLPEYGVGRAEVSVSENTGNSYTFVEVIDIIDDTVAPAEPELTVDSSSGALSVILPPGTLHLTGEPSARTQVSFVPAQQAIRGDYNGDGAVSIADLVAMVLLAVRKPADPSLDFNRDSRYGLEDIMALLLHIRKSGIALLAGTGTVQPLSGVTDSEREQVMERLEKLELGVDETARVRALLGIVSLPGAFSLAQNSPNPFNPSTTISYSLPGTDPLAVRLEIFDIRGRLVRLLVDGVKEPGYYETFWDGTDSAGRELGSGVYFYRLSAGGESSTRKMIMLK